MRDSMHTTKRMIMDGTLQDDTDDLCLRGVADMYLPSVAARRQRTQHRAMQLVLLEQQVHVDMDWNEPECIAAVYAEASALSQAAAHERALQDKHDAWMM